MNKLYAVILLVLVASLGFAQVSNPPGRFILVNTHTTYGTSSADTTSYFGNYNNLPILQNSEVMVIFTSSDSVQAAVYVIAKSAGITAGVVAGTNPVFTTYTDSISTISWGSADSAAFRTKPSIKAIVLRDGTLNRFAGATTFKVGWVPTSAFGTRVTRKEQMWLYVKQ